MRRWFVGFILLTLVSLSVLGWQTYAHLTTPPATLSVVDTPIKKAQVLDRHATPLMVTYQNRWNVHEYLPLHDIPETLQQIFILAEDKRFYEHGGPDWVARFHAMWQNLLSLGVVRGASTISEQVVRIIYPRPRTFWSRWLEGFEASLLEEKFSKADILEFYLNQVPYLGNRRGVVQAARYYFDRDLNTLNFKEMIALSVLVRAPTRLDLKKGTTEIEKPIEWLLQRMLANHVIDEADYEHIQTMPLQLHETGLPVQATHFVDYIYTSSANVDMPEKIVTTLDAQIQTTAQAILDQRIQDLVSKRVQHGAMLIVDNQTRDILAWVNASKDNTPISYIDAVLTPRQPGSALKPFLYALALKKGWTAATIIDDSPLAAAVGVGLHSYHNYSRSYYGPLRLRDALGNSLNIPAIRTIQFVGPGEFLRTLHDLGMSSLTAHPEYYGDGLALGNGGITLFELVQAYVALANHGEFQPLKTRPTQTLAEKHTVFTPEVTSIIADILSDTDARRLEFGSSALLRFPVQTAIKTGTSTDYHDAWAVGFNHQYTVGVWLGNLDQQPMTKVSGSSGPALILRAVFAELNRYSEAQPLYVSPKLIQADICRTTGQKATQDCSHRSEWFIAGTEPTDTNQQPQIALNVEDKVFLRQPSHGLQLAMDPRIPDEYEAFTFKLSQIPHGKSVEWLVDNQVVGTTSTERTDFLWPLEKGKHIAQARIWLSDASLPLETPKVSFVVK